MFLSPLRRHLEHICKTEIQINSTSCLRRPSFVSQVCFLHSRNDQLHLCNFRECTLENTTGTGKSAQNTTTSGWVCISKQRGSTGVGLQSGTIGAEDLMLAAYVGEGILLRISSILITRTNYLLILGVYLPVQFHVKIKSQFIRSEKSPIRGNTQKCTAGLNSLAITDLSKDCYFM